MNNYSQKQPMTTNQLQPTTNDPTKHCWNNQVCILNNSLCSCTHLSNFQRHRSTAEAIFTLFNCEPPPSVARAFHLALILSRWGSMHLKMMHLSTLFYVAVSLDIIHRNTRIFLEFSACLFCVRNKTYKYQPFSIDKKELLDRFLCSCLRPTPASSYPNSFSTLAEKQRVNACIGKRVKWKSFVEMCGNQY